MPNTKYMIPENPTWKHHLLAHPYATTVAISSFLIGTMVFWAEFTGVNMSLVVFLLPTHLTIPIGILHVFSSVLILYATYHFPKTPWKSWAIERFGLILALTAWLSWASASFVVEGTYVLRILTTMLSVASVVRLCAIHSSMKAAEKRSRVKEST